MIIRYCDEDQYVIIINYLRHIMIAKEYKPKNKYLWYWISVKLLIHFKLLIRPSADDQLTCYTKLARLAVINI